jgi:hypothetical protein
MGRFAKDIADRLNVPPAKVKYSRARKPGLDGRWEFTIRHGKHKCVVDMPGRALYRVRWMKEPGQDIWEFPRLYVDGSSWVWLFAIRDAARELSGENAREAAAEST